MTTITVVVVEVGGNTLVKDVTPWAEEGEWATTLDKQGNIARVTLTNCLDTMWLAFQPWFHELHIYVDGMPAFIGPILYFGAPNRDDERPTIIGQDMTAWFTVRHMRDLLNFTQNGNGFTATSTVIREFVRSAMRPYDPNLLSQLDVIENPVLHSRQVMTILPPSEELWGTHLSSMVGTVTHMSVHGRRITFWPINDCLRQLPDVNASDFINFPNSVRDGDKFATRSVFKGRDTSALLTADAPKGDNILSGSFKQAGFFIGQSVSVNTTGVTLPLDTIVVDMTDADITISNSMREDVSSGASVRGFVYGEDGGASGPILVERVNIDETLVGVSTATEAARLQTTDVAPFSGFENTFKAEITCDTPWIFSTIAPGMCTNVTTVFGDIELQIESVSGKWGGDGINLYASLKSPGPPISVHVPVEVPEWEGPRVQSTARELPTYSIAGLVNETATSPAYPAQSGRDLIEMAVTVGSLGPLVPWDPDEGELDPRIVYFDVLVNGVIRGRYKAEFGGLATYDISIPINRGDMVSIQITDVGLGEMENLLIALRAVK